MAVERAINDVLEAFKSIKPGELIVVEYTPLIPLHLAVSLPIRIGRERKIQVVINDIFDQFHVLLSHLATMGVDTSWAKDVPVVKFGGSLSTGKVINRISILKATPVWHMEYEKALKEVPGLKLIVTLGLEKLIAIKSELPASTVCRMTVASSLGAEDRINVTFINRDMLTESTLEDIRELASRVFELGFENGKLTLRTLKSLRLEDYGRKLSIDASALLDYLAT
ncbi:DUF257 family protein [Thermococcus sp. LS1]|uniref:DUF257 family protein n=1 Tax=Thermococcus sp. LS1 TaxID=1638259 RepID=UPI001439B3DB